MGFWCDFGMIIGYARVSTTDQKLDAQLDALKEAGAGRVFSETINGATTKRPELQHVVDASAAT